MLMFDVSFHKPKVTIKKPSRKKLITLTCSCGCGETFQQRPCDAKKCRLHFKNREHHGRWLYNEKLRKQRENPPELPGETSDVGAKPKTPQPSLEESVKLQNPEEKDKVNA